MFPPTVVDDSFAAGFQSGCRDSAECLRLEIIAIKRDKKKELADRFLQGMDVNFVVAFDPAGDTASTYGLRGMPGSYLIGRDGFIHATHLGFVDRDKDKLEAAINRLLQY